jgi:hypothetical protein
LDWNRERETKEERKTKEAKKRRAALFCFFIYFLFQQQREGLQKREKLRKKRRECREKRRSAVREGAALLLCTNGRLGSFWVELIKGWEWISVGSKKVSCGGWAGHDVRERGFALSLDGWISNGCILIEGLGDCRCPSQIQRIKSLISLISN